ncbi:MAG: hypothetical protein U0359_18855 [Byssovorax sp.]
MEASRNPNQRPALVPVSPRKVSAESCLTDGSFIAEATLGAFVRQGEIRREGAVVATPDGRRFVLQEAVRVLGRNNGASDPYGFTGQVDSIRELVKKGGAITGDTLRLGSAAYDVEYGFVAAIVSAPRA